MVMLLTTNEYLLYIGVPVGIVLLLFIIFLVFNAVKKKSYLDQRKKANIEMINYFGGKDNIISAKAQSSRLSLVLKDYNVLDENKLKELGVSSIIKMSNKVILVIGEEASKIAEIINK